MGAVDQVLLTERDELAGLAEGLSLEGSGGAEGPAAAALALVLDGSDVALGAPVHGGRHLHVQRGHESGALLLGGVLHLQAVHHLHKFSGSLRRISTQLAQLEPTISPLFELM